MSGHEAMRGRGTRSCGHRRCLVRPLEEIHCRRALLGADAVPDAGPHHAGETLCDVAYVGAWGKYEGAVRRWEALTRPAPAPTIEGAKGQPKLSPAFVEWMQGYPAGWCDGLTDNQQLKAYGNSVCPQQGMAAVALLEAAHTEAVAA